MSSFTSNVLQCARKYVMRPNTSAYLLQLLRLSRTKGGMCVLAMVLAVLIRKHGKSWLLSTRFRPMLSQALAAAMFRPRMSTTLLRSTFRETSLPYINANQSGHSHPESAAWRSSAVVFANSLAMKLGLDLHIYQGSPADVRDGLSVSRSYYWAKDTAVDAKPFNPPTNSIVAVVDVDYYMDMNEFLLQVEQPVLLYTFQPKLAAKECGEFSYTFLPTGEVSYKVAGGAAYVHQVWDYGADVIAVSNWRLTKYYLVERRAANDHHEYVLLIPMGCWRNVWAVLAKTLSATLLKRLDPINTGFVCMDVQTSTGLYISIARVGEYNAAYIERKTFDALRSIVRTSAVKVGNATVQSWVKDRYASSIINDYFRQTGDLKTALVYTAPEGIRTYQLLRRLEDYSPNEKSLMLAYMSPVYPNTFVPDRSLNNEKAAVLNRVVRPHAEGLKLSNDSAPTKFLWACLHEFIGLMLPEDMRRTLRPVSMEEVYLRQGRPSQRMLLEQAEGADYTDVVKTFLKAEPYQKPGDPRVITTYDTCVKRDYACYIYSLTDYCERLSWYAFGKTPLEIANEVARICAYHGIVLAMDANKMDGHVQQLLRDFERCILTAAFHVSHTEQVCDLHSRHFNKRAFTRGGVKYPLSSQRGSGELPTALFNGVFSKAMDYTMRRLCGVPAQEAYDAPGLFGGDDGIACSASPLQSGSNELVKAGAMFGQSLAVDVFMKGESGVNFLSRFYTPDVWEGDNASHCDLKRTLSKLHVTPALTGFTPLQKLSQKLTGLMRSDCYTPIIRQILNAALRVGLDVSAPHVRGLTSWWAQYDANENWPTCHVEDEGKMIEQLGDVDVKELFEYLEKIQTPIELLSMPAICEPPEHKAHPNHIAVVDDEVIDCTVTSEDVDICWKYVEGKCDNKCGKHHTKVCKAFLVDACTRKNCKFRHVKP
jgi:hypothetical protein